MAQPYPSFTSTYHHTPYPKIDPSQPSLDSSNKTVLITGAGSGIGRAIALAFTRAHARAIALLGRTETSLLETAEMVGALSRSINNNTKDTGAVTRTVMVTVDVTDTEDVRRAMREVVVGFGDRVPDIVVNNAGGNLARGTLEEVDAEAFMKTMELNVKGPLNVIQTLCRLSREGEAETTETPSTTTNAGADKNEAVERTIINIPSGIVHLPYAPGGAAYSISKLAGAKLLEYAHHENPNWRCFNMQPGVVATELAKRAGRQAPDSPELAASLAVWLARSSEAVRLNGRFVWANWDMGEILESIDEIERRGLLTLGLRGYAEDESVEGLVGRATGLYRGPAGEEKKG